MVHTQAKAVEVQGFGIVGPLFEKWASYSNPLEKGPLSSKEQVKLRQTQNLKTVVLALDQ